MPSSEERRISLQDDFQGKNGQFWCLTDDFKGCRIVGRFDSDGNYELFVPAASIQGRVIFTNMDIGDSQWNILKTWAEKLRLANQPLPSFIPTDMN